MKLHNKVGDIVLIPFPFSDLSGKKIRPSIILQHDREDILVVFITSVKPEGEFMKINKTEINNLSVDSFIRFTKINAVDARLALGAVGTLTSDELKTLRNRIKEFLVL